MKQGYIVGVALSFLVPSVASAHVALVDPPPRSGDNGLVMEPCGGVAPTGTPTQYMAGETITVQWEIGMSHGGTVRIDLAEADDMGFDANVLAMDLPDTDGAPNSADVVLPNVDCDACTLRVIQQNPEEDNYVSCADVQLMGATAGSTGGGDTGSGDSTGGDTTGPSGDDSDTGPVGGDSTGGGDDSPPATDGPVGVPDDGSSGGSEAEGDDGGGCSCTTTPTSAPAWMLLLGLLALPRRRR
jgi:MYXO-CTERM domain-containing protein